MSSTPPEQSPAPEARVSRKLTKAVAGFETAEGAGSRVKRSIGTPGLWNLSPFLILDYARVRPGEGFPDHPHRGMSTLTYLLEGQMQHEDFTGHVGALRPGDVQFMTAGRGIVHSEMPAFDEDRPVDAVVLQLWIDLPAAKKMVKPHYQEKKASQLGHATFDGGSVAIVSGESHGSVGPVRPVAGTCWFMDFRLLPGGQVWQPLPEGWTAFVYVLTGTLAVGDGDKVIEPHYTAVFSSDKGENGVLLRKPSGKQETRFVLVAGEPLNQPVIQQGPFVTTSKEAAVQALRDYDGYRNGFEKARGWSSTIGNPGRRPAKKR